MSKVVQEKFQVNEPLRGPQDHTWASDASARRSKSELRTRSTAGRYETYGSGLNDLPPGSNIERQNLADIDPQPMSSGNMGNGDQVTTDVTPESARTGFDRKSLRPTDDMYTREHHDAFYDSIVVDGVEGFVERNNTLDRS